MLIFIAPDLMKYKLIMKVDDPLRTKERKNTNEIFEFASYSKDQFRLSVQRPAILTEIRRGFPYSLDGNAGKVP
jgi:hypothetical protein